MTIYTTLLLLLLLCANIIIIIVLFNYYYKSLLYDNYKLKDDKWHEIVIVSYNKKQDS